MSVTQQRFCGATGCGQDEDLIIVTAGDTTRTLCPDCATDFIRSEAA